MRRILLAVTLLLMLAVVSPAIATNFAFDWPQTNTDGSNLTDLAGVKVYTCPGTPCTKANGVKTGPDIAAPAPDPPTGSIGTFSLTSGKGFVFVTAFDTFGNESAESNLVPFDSVPPGAPVLRSAP